MWWYGGGLGMSEQETDAAFIARMRTAAVRHALPENGHDTWLSKADLARLLALAGTRTNGEWQTWREKAEAAEAVQWELQKRLGRVGRICDDWHSPLWNTDEGQALMRMLRVAIGTDNEPPVLLQTVDDLRPDLASLRQEYGRTVRALADQFYNADSTDWDYEWSSGRQDKLLDR